MAWRADCPTRDLDCTPLSVHSWFRLPNPDGFFIQRAHLFVTLSTTFAHYQSITQLCLYAWSVVADMCSTIFVEHFLASRVKRVDVTVSTFFYSSSLVPNVLPVSPM